MTPSSETDIPRIRVVFMGTPEFAAHILGDLLSSRYDIIAVYTQADKPVGRDRVLTPSPVKNLVTATAQIPLEQPIRFDGEAFARLQKHAPDLIIVAAYGKILPKRVLDLPSFGCVNVHASLLPRWRGASPVQNAILAGDMRTGITLMLMDEHMDTGPVIAREELLIEETDTTPTLLEKLAPVGSALLLRTLPTWIKRESTPIQQEDTHVTMCQLIDREDGHIFWNETAPDLERRYRALTPWPGLFTFWQRSPGTLLRIKIIEAEFLSEDSPMATNTYPLGTVYEEEDGIHVRCGQGSVLLRIVQIEGKGQTPVTRFKAGYMDFVGSTLS